MESQKRITPKYFVIFAASLGGSIWVASSNLAIALGLAVITIGVFLSIVRGDW